MFSGVIFDMDGVLVDSHPLHRSAWRRLLASLGREVTEAELNFVTEGAKREDILRHFLGDLTMEQLETLGRRKHELFEEEAGQLRPVQGLEQFLAALEQARIPMAVVTNAARARTELTLTVLGWSDRFAVVFTGDDLPQGKSGGAIFRKTAESLGVPPHHLVVIEDSKLGITAAKQAGMKCVGIAEGTRAADLQLAGADHVVPDFTRLHLSDLLQLFS